MDSEVDIYNPAYVRGVFDRVSSTYGYTNYLASFGFTERWRKECVRNLGSLPDGAVGFDLMSGRGETWNQLFSRHKGIAKLTAIDISVEMIKGAREQAAKLAASIELLELDVFDNSIESGSADFVISTFGIKTFNAEQLRQLAGEVARILKVGGRFSLIEVSEPRDWALHPLYMFYLAKVMPIIEKVFLGYSYGYSMIGVYVSRFGSCREFSRLLQEHGLQVSLSSHFYGCATSVHGVKM